MGCGQLHDELRLEGRRINHKRTARSYRELGLALRRRRRRKLPVQASKLLQETIRRTCANRCDVTVAFRYGLGQSDQPL